MTGGRGTHERGLGRRRGALDLHRVQDAAVDQGGERAHDAAVALERLHAAERRRLDVYLELPPVRRERAPIGSADGDVVLVRRVHEAELDDARHGAAHRRVDAERVVRHDGQRRRQDAARQVREVHDRARGGRELRLRLHAVADKLLSSERRRGRRLRRQARA